MDERDGNRYVVFAYGDCYHEINEQTGATLCGIPEGTMLATYYHRVPLINLEKLPLCGTCQAAKGQDMSEKMFIDTLNELHPERVLNNIHLDYSGFRVRFDLPGKRSLQIEINAFVKKNGTVEVYEHLQGRETSTRYWLVKSNRYYVEGTDPLPLLTSYLKTTLGGIECSYEDSFAEVILAGLRNEKEEVSEL